MKAPLSSNSLIVQLSFCTSGKHQIIRNNKKQNEKKDKKRKKNHLKGKYFLNNYRQKERIFYFFMFYSMSLFEHRPFNGITALIVFMNLHMKKDRGRLI